MRNINKLYRAGGGGGGGKFHLGETFLNLTPSSRAAASISERRPRARRYPNKFARRERTTRFDDARGGGWGGRAGMEGRADPRFEEYILRVYGREAKREEVRCRRRRFYYSFRKFERKITPPPPAAAVVGPVFLLGRFSFLIFPLSSADILKVLNI